MKEKKKVSKMIIVVMALLIIVITLFFSFQYLNDVGKKNNIRGISLSNAVNSTINDSKEWNDDAELFFIYSKINKRGLSAEWRIEYQSNSTFFLNEDNQSRWLELKMNVNKNGKINKVVHEITGLSPQIENFSMDSTDIMQHLYNNHQFIEWYNRQKDFYPYSISIYQKQNESYPRARIIFHSHSSQTLGGTIDINANNGEIIKIT